MQMNVHSLSLYVAFVCCCLRKQSPDSLVQASIRSTLTSKEQSRNQKRPKILSNPCQTSTLYIYIYIYKYMSIIVIISVGGRIRTLVLVIRETKLS